jgi:hypothetical protein
MMGSSYSLRFINLRRLEILMYFTYCTDYIRCEDITMGKETENLIFLFSCLFKNKKKNGIFHNLHVF